MGSGLRGWLWRSARGPVPGRALSASAGAAIKGALVPRASVGGQGDLWAQPGARTGRLSIRGRGGSGVLQYGRRCNHLTFWGGTRAEFRMWAGRALLPCGMIRDAITGVLRPGGIALLAWLRAWGIDFFGKRLALWAVIGQGVLQLQEASWTRLAVISAASAIRWQALPQRRARSGGWLP